MAVEAGPEVLDAAKRFAGNLMPDVANPRRLLGETDTATA